MEGSEGKRERGSGLVGSGCAGGKREEERKKWRQHGPDKKREDGLGCLVWERKRGRDIWVGQRDREEREKEKVLGGFYYFCFQLSTRAKKNNATI